MREWRRKRIY